MKTSTVLASMLFGFAMAAPVDKRARFTKTEVVTETVVVYTTVYDDAPAPSATGLFYEQPKPSAPAAVTTPAAVPSPVAQAQPSQPPVQQPATPAQTPVQQQPAVVAPVPSAAPVQQQPPVSNPAPSSAPAVVAPSPPASQPVTSAPTSGKYSGDITIYDNNGGFGACGTALHDSDMIVAIAQPAWGKSTYDVMTGQATNPWCNQKVQINYNGKSIVATIMDMCPGCSGHDLDLSVAAWTALTGTSEKTRFQATWSPL